MQPMNEADIACITLQNSMIIQRWMSLWRFIFIENNSIAIRKGIKRIVDFVYLFQHGGQVLVNLPDKKGILPTFIAAEMGTIRVSRI